ncbi:hypothetical protein ACEWY4_009072 [Coilia grayii]|uniref:Uromodulin-like 1 n=1 Tax=Coilia grayii TaxID=363190 RepID=A0ABD1K627_9TELE
MTLVSSYQRPYVQRRSCGGWLPWRTCEVTLYRVAYRSRLVSMQREVTQCCSGYEQVGSYCALPLNRSAVFTAKPGSCPKVVPESVCASKPQCRWDTDCSGWQKCCSASEGLYCTDPDPPGVLNSSDVGVFHVLSWCASPFTTSSSLLITSPSALVLVDISSRLQCLLRDIEEVVAVTVQDVNECAHQELNACPPESVCVNTVGSYLCSPEHAPTTPCSSPHSDASKPPPITTAAPLPDTSYRATDEVPQVVSIKAFNITSSSFSVSWTVAAVGEVSFQVVILQGSTEVWRWVTSQTEVKALGLQAGVLYRAKVLQAVARLTNVEFTASLLDSESPEYKNLSQSIEAEILKSLPSEIQDLVGSGMVRVVITGFSNGSVVVNFTIVFVTSESQDIVAVSNSLMASLQNSSKYAVDANSTSIQDPNECLSGDVDCSPDAECINTFGGYDCVCKDGFEDTDSSRRGTSCIGRSHNSTIDIHHNSTIDINHNSTPDINHNSTPDINHNYTIDINHNFTIDINHNSTTDINHNYTIDINHNFTIDINHNYATDINHNYTTHIIGHICTPDHHNDRKHNYSYGHISTSDHKYNYSHGSISTSDRKHNYSYGHISTSDHKYNYSHGSISTTNRKHNYSHGSISTSDHKYNYSYGHISTTDRKHNYSYGHISTSDHNATTAMASTVPVISHSLTISVECKVGYMSVSVARSFLVDKKIPEDSLYLGLSECGVNAENSTHVQLVAEWDGCNTVVIKNDTHNTLQVMLYNNMSSHTWPDGSVSMPSARLQVPILCSYVNMVVISAGYSPLAYEMIKDIVQGSGNFHVTVRLLNGTTPLPENYTLALDEEVVVEVSINSTFTQVNVVLNKCWATPTFNPSGPEQFVFLEKGCPVNERYTTVLQNGNATRALLKVKIFSLVDVNVDSIYLHCQIEICFRTGESSCLPDCEERVARLANLVGTAKGSCGPYHRSSYTELSFHVPPEKATAQNEVMWTIAFSVLGVGLGLLFVGVILGAFCYKRRIGTYDFNFRPRQENFTYHVFNT